MGSGSRVADCQEDGSVEDGRTKCWWGRSDELCFIVVGISAPFPFLVVGAVSVDVVNGESRLLLGAAVGETRYMSDETGRVSFLAIS
jgi:hypothetical protein